jgi:hypothetical protein
VSNRTTTTTVVKSEKDQDGNWSEYVKIVTTVVERDDDGYPYGAIPTPPSPITFPKRRYSDIADYLTWYNYIGAIPASKRDTRDVNDG